MKGCNPNTVNVYIAALRFLFEITLQRPEVRASVRVVRSMRAEGSGDGGRVLQASCTTTLPKFFPSSIPMRASGARSRPDTTSSRYFTFPSATHGVIARRNSGSRGP